MRATVPAIMAVALVLAGAVACAGAGEPPSTTPQSGSSAPVDDAKPDGIWTYGMEQTLAGPIETATLGGADGSLVFSSSPKGRLQASISLRRGKISCVGLCWVTVEADGKVEQWPAGVLPNRPSEMAVYQEDRFWGLVGRSDKVTITFPSGAGRTAAVRFDVSGSDKKALPGFTMPKPGS